MMLGIILLGIAIYHTFYFWIQLMVILFVFYLSAIGLAKSFEDSINKEIKKSTLTADRVIRQLEAWFDEQTIDKREPYKGWYLISPADRLFLIGVFEKLKPSEGMK